jgi:hypothetical protein
MTTVWSPPVPPVVELERGASRTRLSRVIFTPSSQDLPMARKGSFLIPVVAEAVVAVTLGRCVLVVVAASVLLVVEAQPAKINSKARSSRRRMILLTAGVGVRPVVVLGARRHTLMHLDNHWRLLQTG